MKYTKKDIRGYIVVPQAGYSMGCDRIDIATISGLRPSISRNINAIASHTVSWTYRTTDKTPKNTESYMQ